MSSWEELIQSAPEFGTELESRFDARTHKTLATIRADGSPRISGIETFVVEGELWFGSMPDARKAQDLRRDPRMALHCASDDPPADDPQAWGGDAKLNGLAEEILDPDRRLAIFRANGSNPPAADSHLFRVEIAAAALIQLNATGDRLVIELWRPGHAVTRMERE
jgi:Pyridoxamine 5'-phosphate oxidase